MAIKTYRPVTKSRRFMTTLVRENISKKRPERSLTEFIGKTGGRNNLGRLTSYHRGGGHKQLYRVVDFKREKDGVKAQVTAIEYDPNRSANIALVQYADGEKRYILAPQGLQVGQNIENGTGAEIATGNCLPLKNIPLGTFVHNIEMKPGKGGQLVRSAGVGSQLMARQERYAYLTMPSGELRLVFEECRATIGMVGNADHSNVTIGKAGRSRWLGKRSRVRAICRNPVDHPMGGGEGRSKSNKHPQSMWGVLAKGKKTRKPGLSDKFIVSRRKSKRKA